MSSATEWENEYCQLSTGGFHTKLVRPLDAVYKVFQERFEDMKIPNWVMDPVWIEIEVAFQ
ncbi:hypothetical protein T4B_12446 [Trichinella pseudospiralis]|uniref:Uncharacterized protein n=1 Tax=Trichinella pseudospiralis TaxID=6337 RepID=A0A0V1HRZ6_TRIPS|nr:hypothetical protein T4B_12446 [Trichinella pseudospiralis]